MSDLLTAYERVRSRHSDYAWYALSPRAITEAIYREIRQIDEECLTFSGAAQSREQSGEIIASDILQAIR